MPSSNRLKVIEKIVSDANAPHFTLGQIKEAIYKNGVTSYMDISNTPEALRVKLAEELGGVLTLRSVHESKGNQAHKILFETRDGERVEAVRMTFHPKDSLHESLCISSQSGCALGCKFCATGAIGFKKNLTADEISDQILYFRDNGYKIDSVSFMGMGEPFANPNFFEALKMVTDPSMLGISPRRLSVSTVGIIPGIKRLTDEFPQVNLAFSLHSPFPGERLKIMPVTKAYPVSKVFETLDEHIKKTNKRVFVAYVLLGGLNDTDRHAKELVKLIKARGKSSYLYHVNLIRFNPGPTISEYKRVDKSSIEAFMKVLKANGIACNLRQSFGVNIDAACGQLYGGYNPKKPV